MRPIGQDTWSMVGHRCCRLLLSEVNSMAGCAVEGAAVRPTYNGEHGCPLPDAGL